MLRLLLPQRRKLGPFAVAEPIFCIQQLQKALPVKRAEVVAGVCGSLDHLLVLLRHGPRKVLAFAADPAQAALGELKIAGIRNFDRSQYLRLLGWEDAKAEERRSLYAVIEGELTPAVRSFFAARPEIIAQGVLEYALFRQWARQLFTRLGTLVPDRASFEVMTGIQPGGTAERVRIYRRSIRGSRMVRFAVEPLLRIFPGLLEKQFFQRSPMLSGEVVRTLTREAFDILEYLVAHGLASNPAFERHITGHVPDGVAHEVLSEQAFAEIKQNIHRIHLVPRHLVEGLRLESPRSIHHLFLGNLPDFLTVEWQGWLVREIERVAADQARFLCYSLVPQDRIHRARSQHFRIDDRLSIEMSTREPSHLFPVVSVYSVLERSASAILPGTDTMQYMV